eukprot:TRINITY_DN31103_c0_g1_i1.p1 TRINITY_DN31103_c0_g1~~TRINITY_DN31103_c0_g1_i1.p1  ORF type:complete len:147 (+),score=38.70 TRINITY_DN31103_c0_g1_i1:36-443(+)
MNDDEGHASDTSSEDAKDTRRREQLSEICRLVEVEARQAAKLEELKARDRLLEEISQACEADAAKHHVEEALRVAEEAERIRQYDAYLYNISRSGAETYPPCLYQAYYSKGGKAVDDGPVPYDEAAALYFSDSDD